MRCYFHPDRTAYKTCNYCHRPVCQDCIADYATTMCISCKTIITVEKNNKTFFGLLYATAAYIWVALAILEHMALGAFHEEGVVSSFYEMAFTIVAPLAVGIIFGYVAKQKNGRVIDIAKMAGGSAIGAFIAGIVLAIVFALSTANDHTSTATLYSVTVVFAVGLAALIVAIKRAKIAADVKNAQAYEEYRAFEGLYATTEEPAAEEEAPAPQRTWKKIEVIHDNEEEQ